MGGTSASPSPQTDRFTLGTLDLSSANRLSVVDVTVVVGSSVSDGGEEVDCIGPMFSMGLPVVGGSLCWARVALSPAAPAQVKTLPVVLVDDSRCWEGDVDPQDAPLRLTPSPPPDPLPTVRSRRLGKVASHVRFLRHLFRSCRRQRPGMWGLPGGMRGIVFYRPVTVFRCRGGRCLASPDAFADMQRRKVGCLEYYSIYVDILSRLAKRTPRSYHPFAAAGADALGVRRARGTPYGSDWIDQPHFRGWFGDRAFQVSDASVRSELETVMREWAPDVTMASPPCQPYSTADMPGVTESWKWDIKSYCVCVWSLGAPEGPHG